MGARGDRTLASFVVCSAIVALCSYGAPYLAAQYGTSSSGSGRSLESLAAFRPTYESAHRHPTDQLLHTIGTSVAVVVVLAHPPLIPVVVIAVHAGLAAIPLLRHQQSGLVELAVVVAVYLSLAKLLTRRVAPAAAALVVVGAFAIAGHVAFGRVRAPVALLYPTYSLICDALAWIQWVAGVTITL